MGRRNLQEQFEFFSHSRSEQFLKQNTIEYSTFQRPWTVVLLKYEGRIASVRCGASIISPKMVITAASCFFDEKTRKPLDMSDYSVVLGTNDPMNVTEGFERRLSRVMIHPNYKYPQVCMLQSIYDIATIEDQMVLNGSAFIIQYKIFIFFPQAYFDIALIELEGEALEFTMTVHPVCLPSEIPDDIDKWEGRLIDIGKNY